MRVDNIPCACPNGPAPDKSGCRTDNFQVFENEMAPHIDMFRAMALRATSSC
jgi:hypothetical protein